MVRSAIDPIRPGASLILAWQIKQRHAIIIGGGFVAAGRKIPRFMIPGHLPRFGRCWKSNLTRHGFF